MAFRIEGSGLRGQDLGFGEADLGFRVLSRPRVQG